MKIAVIGRSESLFQAAILLRQQGHTIVCILTAKEAPEYNSTRSDFQALADEWSIPFASGARIIEYMNFFSAAQADIAISVNYPGIIPQSVVDLFPLGILNAHGGDLPRYRGNACQAWAILNGEKYIGLCIHKMIGGELDNGDIIARDYFSVEDTTKITSVLQWMISRIPQLFLDAVNLLHKNPQYYLERQSMDSSFSLRCYPRLPKDGRIHWHNSNLQILRLINASNKPYSGAYCFFSDQLVTIWDAELVVDREIFSAVPGQVTQIGPGFIDVACGEGKIRILQIEASPDILHPNDLIKSIRCRFE